MFAGLGKYFCLECGDNEDDIHGNNHNNHNNRNSHANRSRKDKRGGIGSANRAYEAYEHENEAVSIASGPGWNFFGCRNVGFQYCGYFQVSV